MVGVLAKEPGPKGAEINKRQPILDLNLSLARESRAVPGQVFLWRSN